jgi:hypothetical protein
MTPMHKPSKDERLQLNAKFLCGPKDGEEMEVSDSLNEVAFPVYSHRNDTTERIMYGQRRIPSNLNDYKTNQKVHDFGIT